MIHSQEKSEFKHIFYYGLFTGPNRGAERLDRPLKASPGIEFHPGMERPETGCGKSMETPEMACKEPVESG